MVSRNRWLDITPQGSKATATRGTQVDQWLTGTVTEQVDSSMVAVDLDGSTEPPVVAPVTAGITYIGARVRCLRDSTGKIVQVEAPLTLPDGVEVIAAGSTGQAIVTAQETATAAQTAVNETQQALDEARTELTSSMSALDGRVSEVESGLSESQDYIEHTVTPGLERAQQDAESAASAAAQAVADGVVSVVTEYAVGSSETAAPTSGWSTTSPARTAGTFIWSRTTTTKGDGTATTSSPVLVTGNTGAAGAAGADGKDGAPGKDGVGLSGTVISYAKSTSGTSVPSSGWQATVPSSTPGQYLWTRTVWSYTDGTSETGYSVSMWGATGAKGDTGSDGIAGKDGVGISSTSIMYAASSSGTTAPTSGWASAPPSASAGQYVWTRTVWTYTDGTTETGYSVGKIGNTGAAGAAGVSVSSVTPYYVLVGTGASAPAKPTTNPPSSSWTLTEPPYTSGVDLYRADLTVMSDNTWSWGAVSKVSSYTAASMALQNAAELVVNGGFENGMTGWAVSGGAVSIVADSYTSPPSGSYMCRMSESSAISQTVVGLSAGRKLRFGLKIRGYQARTLTVTADFGGGSPLTLGSLTSDDWRTWTTDTTVPSGASSVTLTLACDTSYIRIDDVSIRDVTEVQQQAVTLTNLITATAAGLVSVSTTAPDVSQKGRVWIIPSSDGKTVIGMKISNGSTWSSYGLMVEDLMVVGEDGTIQLKNGVVAAPNIKATSDLWTKILAVAGNATIGGNLLVNGAVDASKITASQELWAKLATFAKVTTDMLIAGGAKITGTLLADVITLATRLVAGDPDGTRTELNSDGLSVWRTLADGTAAQAINLGITDGGDYLSILSSAGDTLASIDEDGNVAGAQVTANDSITLAGEDLDERLDAMPQGAIAKVYLNTSTFTLTTDAQTLVSTNVTLPGSAGRQLRVTMAIAFDGGSYPINIELKPSVTSTASSSNTTKKAWQVIGDSTIQTATFVYEINSDELGVDTTSRFLSLAMTGKTSSAGSGNAAIRSLGSYETAITVEDLGAAIPSGRQANTSSGASQGSLTKTETYTATASQSYQSSGAAYGYGGSRVFQGSYGSNTGLRGMWIFPTSILSDLSGATVNKVILRLTNQHSYANSGATARIVAHDSTSLPSTWANPGSVIASVAFAKGQTRDIDLTSALKAGLKSGSIRGVGLYSTSSADYGYWSPTAKLIITYTK